MDWIGNPWLNWYLPLSASYGKFILTFHLPTCVSRYFKDFIRLFVRNLFIQLKRGTFVSSWLQIGPQIRPIWNPNPVYYAKPESQPPKKSLISVFVSNNLFVLGVITSFRYLTEKIEIKFPSMTSSSHLSLDDDLKRQTNLENLWHA